jgi:hypothetical protein
MRPVGAVAITRRHPIAGYLLLTYAISWGGTAVVAWRLDFAFSTPESAMPVFVPVLLGPPLAGIVMTALVNGRAGLRDAPGTTGSRELVWSLAFAGAVWAAVGIISAGARPRAGLPPSPPAAAGTLPVGPRAAATGGNASRSFGGRASPTRRC